jgi:hypothetical protein
MLNHAIGLDLHVEIWLAQMLRLLIIPIPSVTLSLQDVGLKEMVA